MTTSSTHTNHHPLHPRDDREALSALFDGELPAESARFALKRLDHDADWRETCGRWQLIGDTLRGEAIAAAPSDFAMGVMRALAAEREASGAVASLSMGAASDAVAAPVRRRWLGGAALAASVAVAAVLVVRPFSQPSDAQVAAEVAAPAAPVVAASTTPAGAQATASPDTAPSDKPSSPAMAIASTAAAAAVASRRPARTVRSPATRAAQPTPIRVAAADTPAIAGATENAARQPFHPPADDIVTRPWPRSVLSDSAAGALTVGFGSATPSAPSFYPFEPRLQQDPQTARPQPVEAER